MSVAEINRSPAGRPHDKGRNRQGWSALDLVAEPRVQDGDEGGEAWRLLAASCCPRTKPGFRTTGGTNVERELHGDRAPAAARRCCVTAALPRTGYIEKQAALRRADRNAPPGSGARGAVRAAMRSPGSSSSSAIARRVTGLPTCSSISFATSWSSSGPSAKAARWAPPWRWTFAPVLNSRARGSADLATLSRYAPARTRRSPISSAAWPMPHCR